MTIKSALIPIMGAALIGGSVAGVGLTAFAQSAPSSSAPTTQAGAKGRFEGGPGVGGTVTAVSATTITVTGPGGGVYTINTSGATVEKIVNGASTTSSASAIAVGDTVRVHGQILTATLSAKDIQDGPLPTPPAKPVAFGKVTAISGSTITISGMDKGGAKTFTIDATSATITKIAKSTTKGTPPTTSTITVSGIAVGDMISVEGTLSGTSVTATKITDGMGFGPGLMGEIHGAFGHGEKKGN